MIAFPNCKINLGLSIINKRNDGYHNLQTVFYPLAIKDALEIIPDAFAILKGSVTFSSSGLPVPGNSAENLCVKAYRLLQEDYPNLSSVQMHLLKVIPLGAGLGGGSADGAFALKLLNSLFNLHLSADELSRYAAKLGSDCPFFIYNQPCAASGRGEILEPVSLDLSGYTLVVVYCGIAVNTGWAFSQINRSVSPPASQSINMMKDIIQQPIGTWRNVLTNDFEEPVFVKYPVIRSIKDQLYEHGAIYASMSGSGCSVVGIFEKNIKPALNFPSDYQVFVV